MRRPFVAALLVITNPLLVVGVAGAAPADTAPGCVEPKAERNYGAERVVYAMAMDLGGCDWWDGGQIVLEATLSRLDGQGETVAIRWALCGALPARAPSDADRTGSDPVVRTPETAYGAPSDAERARTRSGLCHVFADLDHPTFEAALYQGEISYPWADGTRTVGFSAQCGPPAGCVDLPADPSPALSAGGDLYDLVVGGDGDAE
jgi:hypothetical protein